MKAYYGNRFSPNMSKTPEGFLVCHNVPIARTGWQDYWPSEMGIPGNQPIKVERKEKEVFSPATIASFEGKVVTDDHPPVGIDTCNYAAYAKGVAQNIRRGSNDMSDYLMADLLIYDAALIAEIEAGKREVSCGYECEYKLNDEGSYQQINIVGNHVAVVKAGRAGHKVAIKDTKEELKVSTKRGNIWDRMFGAFCKDAEPEEIKEAADAINCIKDEDSEPAAEKTETADTAKCLMQMDARIARIEKILAKDEEPEEKTVLDELEEELAKDADEESVTIAPESIKDEEPEKSEEEKTSAADAAPLLALVRAMKPVVAALPKEQRQSVSDAMGKAVRDALAIKPTQPANYADLAKRKVADSVANQFNKAAFGEACRKRNPHYKGGK
ncbi:MAG: DUF2213 domain-containing protein [bacterium]